MDAPEKRMTWDDLVAIPVDWPCERYELFDGKLVITPLPTIPHQIAAADVAFPLAHVIRDHDLGQAFPVPIGVRFTPDNVVVPDAAFVARHRKHVIGPEVIDAAPDLIIEVVETPTRERDTTIKRAMYARFGVQEYWIVDAEERTIVILALVGECYDRVAADADGAFHSRAIPGFSMTTATTFAGIEKIWGSSWP